MSSLSSTSASKRFLSELSLLLGKRVAVTTVRDKVFRGRLLGYDPVSLSLCLADVEASTREHHPRVIVRGEAVSEIILEEEPFDLQGLAERLEKVFPNLVKVYEEANLITVMDRIKVTPQGVEGTGPMYERVKRIYDQFVAEKKAARFP